MELGKEPLTRQDGRPSTWFFFLPSFFFFYRVFDSFRPDCRSNRWPLVGWGFLPGFTEFRGLLPSFADFYRVSRQRNLSQKKKQKQNTVKPGRPPLNLIKRLPQCSRRLSTVSFLFFFGFVTGTVAFHTEPSPVTIRDLLLFFPVLTTIRRAKLPPKLS